MLLKQSVQIVMYLNTEDLINQWGYDYVYTRGFSCDQKESSKNTITLQ